MHDRESIDHMQSDATHGAGFRCHDRLVIAGIGVRDAAAARCHIINAALVERFQEHQQRARMRHLRRIDQLLAALAAVVIATAIGLLEITDLRRIFQIQRWEFWLSVVCLVGVAVFGAIPGIGVAIVIAVIEFLLDGWRPYSAVLGRADGVEGYHDVTRNPGARQFPGLLLFRWDAPLFFANAELFKERVLDAVAKAPSPVRWLVVTAEPVTSVDVTAADALAELDGTLHDAGIELCFAELKGSGEGQA